MQAIFLFNARCIGVRDENIAPRKRAQCVRAIFNLKRRIAYRRINAIKQRELPQHQSRFERLELQHLFGEVIEHIKLGLLERARNPRAVGLLAARSRVIARAVERLMDQLKRGDPSIGLFMKLADKLRRKRLAERLSEK